MLPADPIRTWFGGSGGRPPHLDSNFQYAGAISLIVTFFAARERFIACAQWAAGRSGDGPSSRPVSDQGRICAGASLVQLYTALVFAGRALGQIKSGVVSLVHRDRFGLDRRSGREAAQGAVPVRQPIKPTQAAIPR